MKRLDFKDVSIVGDSGLIHNYKDRVLLFKVAPGTIPEYNTGSKLEFDLFIFAYVTDGTATALINDRKYALSKHSLCIITPAHAARLLDASPDFGATFLLLKSGDFRMTSNHHENRNFKSWVNLYFNPVLNLTAEEGMELKDSINYLSSQIDREEPEDKSSFVSNAMERYQLEVEFFLNRRLAAISRIGGATSRQEHIVESLALNIVKNYRTEHKAQYYADQMCFSLQYLNKLLNSQLGMTVGDVISKLLYTTARSMLLSSDLTIQQIAHELHFANQAVFCRFFKKMDGQSPSELRRALKG